MEERERMILLQASITLILTTILIFSTILLSSDATQVALNFGFEASVIFIIIGAYLIRSGKFAGKPTINKWFNISFSVVLLTTIIMYLLFKTELFVVTGFTLSSLDYVIFGIATSILLIASTKIESVNLISWDNIKWGRDIFFVAVGFLFVIMITFYLSVTTGTPFSATPFLGVPFSASPVEASDLAGAVIKGIGGFIEGGLFFTVFLGLLTSMGLNKIINMKNAGGIGLLLIISIVFGLSIAFFHTGLHDPSQIGTLFYIALFFIAGSIYTLAVECSFSFVIAQGLVDATKALFVKGGTSEMLGWGIFGTVMIIGLVGLFVWQPWKKRRK